MPEGRGLRVLGERSSVFFCIGKGCKVLWPDGRMWQVVLSKGGCVAFHLSFLHCDWWLSQWGLVSILLLESGSCDCSDQVYDGCDRDWSLPHSFSFLPSHFILSSLPLSPPPSLFSLLLFPSLSLLPCLWHPPLETSHCDMWKLKLDHIKLGAGSLSLLSSLFSLPLFLSTFLSSSVSLTPSLGTQPLCYVEALCLYTDNPSWSSSQQPVSKPDVWMTCL